MTGRSSWFTADRAADWRDTVLDTVRQGDVDREIADDPQSITIVRAGAALAAQTVRILPQTWPPGGEEMASAGGEESRDEVTVLGAEGLNIQREDRFSVGSQWYEVVYVEPALPNRTEAKARQMQ